MAFQKNYRVDSQSRLKLDEIDASDTSVYDGSKDEGKALSATLNNRLAELQLLLYAEHRRSLLIVLQGADTSGKDGVVRHVFSGVNPQGVSVVSFKKPTSHELERDYLWRIHRRVPRKGHIAIFNRSHYEDVLVPRIEKNITTADCHRRFRQINNFEKMLTEEGTTLLKFFLHIDKPEQKRRLEERKSNPQKQWKMDLSDLKAREKWTEFQEAYEDLLPQTSTPEAPWYVVPANKKWYRNLVVSKVLVDCLEKFQLKYPSPSADPKKWQITD